MSDLNDQKVLTLFPSAKNYSKTEQKILPVEQDEREQSQARGIPMPHHVSREISVPRASVRMSLDELIEVVDAQVELLKSTQKRMKYYLDEIEFFLPDTDINDL